MAGITISNQLKNKLPEDDREGIEEYLWAKSGGTCHLCGYPMNRASDTIEADHDIPESESGATSRDNLELAHSSCNRAKRSNPSVDVRPYLRLRAYAQTKQNIVRYDDFLEHFAITPVSTYVTRGDITTFEFGDGSKESASTFSDTLPNGKVIEYVYVSVPKCAIFNDDDCQPRTIKLAQAWAIFSDLQSNPLHEPPSCRLLASAAAGEFRLVMFDGQHKTIASWMRGADRVTAKVYLNLAVEDTIRLVNSIQAKIKKLPLSPFELAAKMSDEWSARLAEYEATIDPDQVSEQGFINWLPAAERTRGKQAFQAAISDELMTSPDISLLKFVQRAGVPASDTSLMTENLFKTKVLERLLYTKPLVEKGEIGQVLRAREQKNIASALNILNDLMFEPNGGEGQPSEQQLEARRRVVYQSALAYVSTLIRSIYRQVLALDQDRAMLEKIPTDDQQVLIRQAIERVANHPVWSTPFDTSAKMQAVRDALSKNQDAKTAFEAVGLRLGYAIGADPLPHDWYE